MGKKILTFDNIETKKNKFYHNATPTFVKDENINKVLVSTKISFGEKAINTLSVTCIMMIKLSHYI